MKDVKICYSIRDNIGDAINPFIVSQVLGYNPVHADPGHCEITGIGSGLGRFFYAPAETDLLRRMKKEFLRITNPNPVILWSAGFIKTPGQKLRPMRKTVLPAAVRGKLSLKAVAGALGIDGKGVATGDAGILACGLIGPQERKYSIGIIPHDKERGEEKYSRLAEKIPGSTVIDVRGDVKTCLEKIASCEAVLSSSLHGLIIADGMGIPNRQAVLTDKLAGDGFKFDDYYSGYDLRSDPIDLNKADTVSMYDITDHYRVAAPAVEAKKNELAAAFRKYL